MASLLHSTLNTRALSVGSLRYIRSDYPGNLTDAEVQWLLRNGIATIVDLRGEKECTAKPCSLEDKEGFVYMDANSNVLFFCGAGKDRTGVVSAFIMKRLGCSDQAIIEDYMETKDNLMGFLTSYAAEHPEIDLNTIVPNEDNIQRVLKVI